VVVVLVEDVMLEVLTEVEEIVDMADVVVVVVVVVVVNVTAGLNNPETGASVDEANAATTVMATMRATAREREFIFNA